MWEIYHYFFWLFEFILQNELKSQCYALKSITCVIEVFLYTESLTTVIIANIACKKDIKPKIFNIKITIQMNELAVNGG